jgi:hypothetical protein
VANLLRESIFALMTEDEKRLIMKQTSSIEDQNTFFVFSVLPSNFEAALSIIWDKLTLFDIRENDVEEEIKKKIFVINEE